MELFIAFILGFITNFFVWLILFHIIVPKIRFSPQISKIPLKQTPADKSGYRYRFKIENSGKRNIIDLELVARVGVKGHKSNIWSFINIPLNPDGSPGYRIHLLKPSKKNRVGRRQIMFFYTNSADVLHDWWIFPEELRKKSKNHSLKLEEIMEWGSACKLYIYAYGYDSFSGSRKMFRSKEYKLSDIVEGKFERDSLQIVKQENQIDADQVDGSSDSPEPNKKSLHK